MPEPPSILIIDPQGIQQSRLADGLRELGWNVRVAGNADALRQVKQFLPSLVFLILDGNAGSEKVATEIKIDALTCSIPIIAMAPEGGADAASLPWAAAITTIEDTFPTLLAKIHHLLAKQRARKPYVLVVDDEADLVDIMINHLSIHGFIASGASNGAEALDVVRQVQPDAILLDLDMPLLNGWDFLSRVKEEMKDARLPIVILTGTDKRLEDRQEAFELGASDYLLKPCEPQEVIEALKRAMRGEE